MISEKKAFLLLFNREYEGATLSETSVTIYKSTRRHFPEEVNLIQLFVLLDNPSGPGRPHDHTQTHHTR